MGHGLNTSSNPAIDELNLAISHLKLDADRIWSLIKVDRNWFDACTRLFPIARRLLLPRDLSLYDFDSMNYQDHFPHLSDYAKVRGTSPTSIIQDLSAAGIWHSANSEIFKLLNLETLFMRADNFRGLATTVLNNGHHIEKLNMHLDICVQIPEAHIHGKSRASDQVWSFHTYGLKSEDELAAVRACIDSNTRLHVDIISKIQVLEAQLTAAVKLEEESKFTALREAGAGDPGEQVAFHNWYLSLPHKTQENFDALLSGSPSLVAATFALWKKEDEIRYCWECLELPQESNEAGIVHLADAHLSLDANYLSEAISERFRGSWNFFGLNEHLQLELLKGWAQEEVWFTNIRNLLLQIVTIDPTTRQTAEDSERLENEILPRLGISGDDFTAFLTSHKKLFERLGVRRTAFIQWFCRLPESLEQNLIGEAIKVMRGKQNEL
jgi:hypothetical protein